MAARAGIWADDNAYIGWLFQAAGHVWAWKNLQQAKYIAKLRANHPDEVAEYGGGHGDLKDINVLEIVTIQCARKGVQAR